MSGEQHKRERERDPVSLHEGDKKMPPIPVGDLCLLVLADATKGSQHSKTISALLGEWR